MVAEDYTGPQRRLAQTRRARTTRTTTPQALKDADIGYDVYDVDAENRTAPSPLGVLVALQGRHLGDRRRPLRPRRPASPAAPAYAQAARRRDHRRPRLHERRRQAARRRQDRAAGRLGPVPLQPARPTPPKPFCKSNQTQGNGDADDPPGQNFNCVVVVQRLPAVLARGVPADHAQRRPGRDRSSRCSSSRRWARRSFTLNGDDSAQNQDNLYSFLTTSSILPTSDVPAVHQRPGDQARRPAGLRPADRHALHVLAGRRARRTSG